MTKRWPMFFKEWHPTNYDKIPLIVILVYRQESCEEQGLVFN